MLSICLALNASLQAILALTIVRELKALQSMAQKALFEN